MTQFTTAQLKLILDLATYRLKWADGDEFDRLLELIRLVKTQMIKPS